MYASIKMLKKWIIIFAAEDMNWKILQERIGIISRIFTMCQPNFYSDTLLSDNKRSGHASTKDDLLHNIER